MVRTVFVLMLVVTSSELFAREINLSCSYTNVNGGTNVDSVYLNTVTAQASYELAGETRAAKLYSDANTYWFTVESALALKKVQIDRNTLGFAATIDIKGMEMRNEFTGACEIVETKSKI